MNTSGPSCVQTFPYGVDLIDCLATQVIARHQSLLPDLTRICILLPDLQASAYLRSRLLVHAEAAGVHALLGPEITTFSSWVQRLPNHELPVLAEHKRELMLVEALIKHPYLYGEGNPWMLAGSLLELFDELNEVHYQPPDSLDDFLNQLGAAYGMADVEHESLVGEARLVHTLWQAWHQQMHADGVIDRHADQLLRLGESHRQIGAQQHFYLAGFYHFTPAQIHWLQVLIQNSQATLLLQGEAPPAILNGYHASEATERLLRSLDIQAAFPAAEDKSEQFLSRVYDAGTTPLQVRAREAASAFAESPVRERIRVYRAASAEAEAQAVDLQTRLWWLEGRRHIGIVTENRRLARRVRALLERAGIELQDAAGWALSTTSAAATLERWLQCVEEDFPYQPLLDLLKSPFLLPEHDRSALLNTVYRFEQGVILKENIARGLSRYRHHTHFRKNRLPPDLAGDYLDILALLDILATAVAPLQAYPAHGTHPPAQILVALQDSLETLGLKQSLQGDEAGQRVLEELQQMQAATQNSSLLMSWGEFRTWLGRTLERFNFRPASHTRQVSLMSLAQSGLCRFDALIIAGAEREYLPGTPGASPFFNDGVRQALGLGAREQQLAQSFHLYRQALGAAPRILFTHRGEQDGEDILPSPWLERLQTFHRIAYQDELLDEQLERLVGDAATQVADASAALPAPVGAHPAIALDATLVPSSLSASGYKQLVDCPYQFFAARCLKLTPPESIREMLEKSDYGERVHLCLQAFHSDVPGLPGPFVEPLSHANRQTAIDCLEEIAQKVFAKDLEDNFIHRGWLRRWQETIPAYVEWQTARQQAWQVSDTEAHISTLLPAAGITLQGRLDRIDTHQGGIGIIDYKTGKVARDISLDILAGEVVQLPFYAMLAELGLQQPAEVVEYLPLDASRVETCGTLDSEALRDITRLNAQRLQQLFADMRDGQPLPAWGDDNTCRHCNFSGLCRREVWDESGA